jgi:hypothetical protein
VNLWNVEIEEANQTGILATGGDIGILSQACAWDFSLPPLLYRERSTSTVQYHPIGLLFGRFAFTIMRQRFLGVQTFRTYEIRRSLVFAPSAWGESPEPIPHISHPSGINVDRLAWEEGQGTKSPWGSHLIIRDCPEPT